MIETFLQLLADRDPGAIWFLVLFGLSMVVSCVILAGCCLNARRQFHAEQQERRRSSETPLRPLGSLNPHLLK